MADPLTIVGVVAATTQIAEQLVKSTFAVVELVTKLRDAPEATRKQIVHVEHLVSIAKLIIQNPALQVESIASVLRTCLGEIQGLQAVLERIKIHSQLNDFEKFQRALKSVLKSKEVNTYLERLEREKASLILCIQETDSEALFSIGITIDELKDEIGKVSSVVNDNARSMRTVIDVMGPMATSVGNIEADLPAIARNVTTIFEKIPVMSQAINEITVVMQQLSLPKDIQELSNPDKLPSHTCFDVPNRRVRPFFGRKDIMQQLDDVFSAESSPKIAVLQGMGGQGKSSTALEYCHLRRENPFNAVFWANATSRNALEKSFENIYEKIKSSDDHCTSITARVSFVLQGLASWPSRWLLVLDNYDDLIAFPSIQDFFPDSLLGAILVTSRHAGSSGLTLGSGSGFIQLQGLNSLAAADFLMQQSQVDRSAANIDSARIIAERLGCHPLAIAQAGSYIRKRRLDLSRFADHYNHRKKAILTNTPQITQYTRVLGDDEKEISLNVFTTWELSFNQLQSYPNASLATSMLTLFAFFDCNDISEAFFITYFNRCKGRKQFPRAKFLSQFANQNQEWDSDAFLDVITSLDDLCLLQYSTSANDCFSLVSLHPLIRDWIRLRTEDQRCLEIILDSTAVLNTFLASVREKRQYKLSTTARQSTALHVTSQEENYNDYAFLIRSKLLTEPKVRGYLSALDWFAHFLKTIGDYKVSERIQERVSTEMKTVFGAEHPNTLNASHALAKSYSRQGKYKEAEDLLLQVVETSKRVLGDEHPHTLTTMRGLAVNYSYQKRNDEAAALNLQVVETSKRVCGDEHPDTIIDMHGLARSYLGLGKRTEAEELFLHVIDASRRVQGDEHPNTLVSMHLLASTFADQGRLVEAENLQLRVLEIRKRVIGNEHPDTIESMHNLAWIYDLQGRLEEAEELGLHVIEARERILGAEHPHLIVSVQNLASIYKQQGRYKEADELQLEWDIS